METSISYLLFFKADGDWRLTWSSRHSLIGMRTEAQPGILFRAPVGQREPNLKATRIQQRSCLPPGKGESPGRTGQKAWDQGFQIGDCTRQERLEARRGQDQEIQSNQRESSRCYTELCSVSCGSLDGRALGGEWIHAHVRLSPFAARLKLSQHRSSAICCGCSTVCYSTDCSTPGFPVLRHLPELAQTRVH